MFRRKKTIEENMEVYKKLRKGFVTSSCKHIKKIRRGKYNYCLKCGVRLVPSEFLSKL